MTITNTLPQSQEEHPLEVISAALLEEEAHKSLHPGVVEWIHGGAGDEWTLARNVERLRARIFRPRRLAGFSQADTSAKLLGHSVAAPLFVCPMGAQDIVHADAEVASVRGAAKAGIPYMLTSASNRSLEEVAEAAPDAMRLFALYSNEDPEVDRDLVQRAARAGYQAVVMTVDSLGPGESERYRAMHSPKSPAAGYGDFDPTRGGHGVFQKMRKNFVPDDIGRLKEASDLPIVVKGILRPDDAERSLAAGAAGVLVSNHGGRTLDGAPAAIDVLPAIVAAVGGRGTVLFDSGVRRGADVLRALALGADAVGIGRPVLDALALGGAEGVASLLNWFRTDLATAMLLTGVPNVAAITSELLEPLH